MGRKAPDCGSQIGVRLSDGFEAAGRRVPCLPIDRQAARGDDRGGGRLGISPAIAGWHCISLIRHMRKEISGPRSEARHIRKANRPVSRAVGSLITGGCLQDHVECSDCQEHDVSICILLEEESEFRHLVVADNTTRRLGPAVFFVNSVPDRLSSFQ